MARKASSFRAVQSAVEAMFDHAFDAGYNMHVMAMMWRAEPSVHTIERMVLAGPDNSGFRRLYELGLVDRSLEQIVIDHSPQFRRSAVTSARLRLARIN